MGQSVRRRVCELVEWFRILHSANRDRHRDSCNAKTGLVIRAAALLWPSHTCLLGGGLSQSEFQRLHGLLQPDKQELWQTIPWKTSLLDAQHAAAREHKPIFMWAMDGHPLGCT